MSDGEYKYWAFISYSHQDKNWGDWLHKTLETYRVPRRLVGRTSRDGAVPRRLYPIFRDREELPSSADLGNNIGDALRRSRYLVVICSPHAAPSRWVNEEIKAFKKLGREDRILALIVDGEPNASDKPDSGLAECFPPALRHKLDARGELSTERVEPIAADARAGKDGRQNAKLKLLAGLLGVAYDELKQRERQRVIQQRIQWSAAALLLLALAIGAWHWKAERDQALADAESGRQALLAGDPFAASVYLNAAYSHGDTSVATRLMLARALGPLAGELHQWHTPKPLLHAEFSGDGSLVLTTEADSLKRWDAANGKLLTDLALPEASGGNSEFSRSGRYAAVRMNDTLVQLYDLKTGQPIAKLQGPELVRDFNFDAAEQHVYTVDWRNTVQFFDLAGRKGARIQVAKDSGFLVSVASERLLAEDGPHMRVWDTRSGKRLAALDGSLEDAYLEPDGKSVRIRSSGHIQFWDSSSGKLLSEIPGPQYRFLIDAGDQIFWPIDDGHRYLVKDYDNKVSLFDSAEGGGSESLPLLTDKTILHLNVYADGQLRLLVQEAPGILTVRDPYAELPVAELAMPFAKPRGVRFDPIGSRVLAYADDGRLLLWNLRREPPQVGAPDYNWRLITPGQWSPDGRHVLYTAEDGALALYDLTAGKTMWESADCKPVFAAPLFDHRGKHIAAGCGAGQWLLLDAASGRRLQNLGTTQFKPRSLSFNAVDDKLVIVGDDTVVWDLAQGSSIKIPVADRSTNWMAAFTPDGVGLAVWGRALRFLNLKTQSVQTSLSIKGALGSEAISLSDDGRILTLVNENQLARWDLSTGQANGNLSLQTNHIHEAAVSHDGRLLLIMDDDDGRVLDSGDGHLVARLEQRAGSATLHERSRDADVDEWDPVSGFNPGDELLLASAGSMLGIWDAHDGRLLSILGRFPKLIVAASFAPDGAHAGASTFGDLRIWDTHLESRPPAEIAAWLACRVPQRLESDKLVAATPDTKTCPAQNDTASGR